MEESEDIDQEYSSSFDFYTFYQSALELDTPPAVQVFLGVLFMVLIIGGNVWVIIAVVRQPKLRRSATNFFIVSLSVSDLIIAVVYIPVHVAGFAYGFPLSDRPACKILYYFHWAAMCGTTFSLICIGVDRFRAIVQPLKPKMTVAHAVMCCSLVWIVSLGYSTFKLFTNDVLVANYTSFVQVGNETVSDFVISAYCHIKDYDLDVIFRYIDLIVLYLVPLAILSLLYACMILKLWFGKSPQGSSDRSKKKAVKMLTFVVIQFAVTWLPNYSLQLYFATNRRVPYISFLWSNTPATMTIYFSLCNSWINPILYAYFNENFRREFKKLLPWSCKCRSQRVSPDQGTAVSVLGPGQNRYPQGAGTTLTSEQ